MAPLIVMLAAWLVARLVGTTGLWLQADSWTGALRIALAAMFVFTAVSHFHPRTRPDLIRMVPASLPAPALLVSATGVLELLGAIGLMVPRALPAAAYGLMALLVAMFPANVHAAREGLMIAGRRAAPLVWRLPLQLFWIAALWWVRGPLLKSTSLEALKREIVMRKIIAALQVSLDGFIEGPNEELDWVDSWEDTFDIIGNVDTFILGARMYPGYEQYWQAVLDNPRSILPFTGRPATEGEIEYAEFAGRTPHVVVSSTLQTVSWKHTRIVRDLEDVRRLKEEPGKDMHAVGGATLVSSLMNAGLVDEIRLVVQPIVLGGGKPLFKDVKERHALTLLEARPLKAGAVWLNYRVPRRQRGTAAEG